MYLLHFKAVKYKLSKTEIFELRNTFKWKIRQLVKNLNCVRKKPKKQHFMICSIKQFAIGLKLGQLWQMLATCVSLPETC